MPDEQPLTPEEHAALDAYETGEGNTEDPASDPQRRLLAERFATLPEVIEHENLLDLVHYRLSTQQEEPVVLLRLNTGLLALVEHLESKWAAHEGRPPRGTDDALTEIVSNHLHDLLHRMATDPTSHPYYGKLWNGLCEAEGLAGYRLADRPAQNGAGKGQEGPF
jgi:hypothetical protein